MPIPAYDNDAHTGSHHTYTRHGTVDCDMLTDVDKTRKDNEPWLS